MNFVLRPFIFCIFVCYSYAWMSLVPNTQKDPHYCNLTEIGRMEFGEIKTIPSICAEAKCHRNGDVSVIGCTTRIPPDNCKVRPGKIEDPYPKCCEDIECS